MRRHVQEAQRLRAKEEIESLLEAVDSDENADMGVESA
jgi:hypothetical protein